MKTLNFTRLILLLIVFSIFASGQEKIESTTNKQVLLNVTVDNIDGESVTDLKAEHFRLYEDKKPVEISHFSKENPPISVGFLLDVSPSMRKAIDLSREGILAFLQKSNSENEYFVAAFTKKIDMLSEFAGSKQTIEIVRASPYFSKSHGDDTSLYDAIFLGIENLSKAKNQKRILFVFGDGEDNKSQKTYKDVEKLIKEKNIIVYFVGHFDVERYAYGAPLEKITKISGGKATYSSNFGQKEKRIIYRSKLYSSYEMFIDYFSKLGDQLQKQYVIGFKPNLDSKENKWRDIEIKLEISKEIKKKIGLAKIRHREGYYPFSEIVTDN